MGQSARHPNRRSIRLKGYDYSTPGAYFVTICTRERRACLGVAECDQVVLSPAGEAVHQTWQSIPGRFPFVELDSFVVMPNHVHGIIWLAGAGQALPGIKGAASSAPTDDGRGAAIGIPGLGDVVRVFKSISAIEGNRLLGISARPFWQRNYYEHVIRDEDDLAALREYVTTNPAKWAEDEYYRNLSTT